MKKVKQFQIGDKVFAKVKGYPPWPAIVVNSNGKKYKVQFYGTAETGFIKSEDLFEYVKYKNQFSKASKKKEFHDALREIEAALEADMHDSEMRQDSKLDCEIFEKIDETDTFKRKRSSSEKSLEEPPPKKIDIENPVQIDKYKKVYQIDPTQIVTEKDTNLKEKEEPGKRNTVEDYNENEQVDNMDKNSDYESSENIQQRQTETPTFEINLVSEENLHYCILYADHVKKNPEIFKEKPVEPRELFKNQALAVKLDNRYVGLKLHKTWPLHFSNEYDAAVYDEEVASRLLLLKESVNDGKITENDEPNLFIKNFNLTEDEIKSDLEMKHINRKFRKVERLRSEAAIVELDINIKNSLSLENADTANALLYLDLMLNANVDEIMLKKHSHLMDMIKLLRKYVGNTEEWDLDEGSLEKFIESAEKIRNKADAIYEKFQNVITLPEGYTNFNNGFDELIRQFKEKCRGLTRKEIFILASEPDSRESFMEKLELASEIDKTDDIADVEKENLRVNSE